MSSAIKSSVSSGTGADISSEISSKLSKSVAVETGFNVSSTVTTVSTFDVAACTVYTPYNSYMIIEYKITVGYHKDVVNIQPDLDFETTIEQVVITSATYLGLSYESASVSVVTP